MTPDELAAAGLYDPEASDAAERLDLLRYLLDHDIDIDTLRAADTAERLVALATETQFDVPGPISCREMAARSGLEPELVARVWRAYGFPVPSLDEPLFREVDTSVFVGFAVTSKYFGVEPMLQWVRVLGSSLNRLADASMSLYLSKIASQLDATHAPMATIARASASSIRQLLEVPSRIIEPVFPHYVVAARRRSDQHRDTGSYELSRLAVGIVDVVDFTPLSALLSPTELAVALDDLEAAASDVATATRTGRIVKYLGDALVFVGEPEDVCRIATELCDRVETHPVLPALRGGVAYGDLLTAAGDFYGPPVNLASRAAALALPGTVLVTDEVVATAPNATAYACALGPQPIKGFAEPIQLHRLRR